MKAAVFLTLLWVAACSQNDGVNSGSDTAHGDADGASDSERGDAGDTRLDASIPDPPEALAPCDATTCRQTLLGGPPCSGFSQSDAYGPEFGLHAYSSMVWDGASTSIRVEPTAGDWQPVIVLARLNGEILYDGDVGAVRPPFQVTAQSAALITVETTQATGVVVYVTSAEALASNFEVSVPDGAAYDITIDSDCGGERLTCIVDEHRTTQTECGWLHYVGKRVVARLDGSRDERLTAASRAAWWSLRQDLMSDTNPIARSLCGTTSSGPLDECAATTWHVGLSGAEVVGQDLPQLEALATRLYDGAMVSGILRTTANEAALDRDNAAAVMQTTGALRASWLLRNTAVGFSIQAPWVTQTCVEGMDPRCYGADTTGARYYAVDREAALRSIDSLYTMFDEMAE